MTETRGSSKHLMGGQNPSKKRFGLRQTRIVGKARDVPITTIKVWMERLPEIIQGYSADDIWNMDKSGLFLKALPDTALAKKSPKKCKAVRNQKSDLLWHFLCPREDSRYVNLLLERAKFCDAFENCLILLNRMVCSFFIAKNMDDNRNHDSGSYRLRT